MRDEQIEGYHSDAEDSSGSSDSSPDIESSSEDSSASSSSSANSSSSSSSASLSANSSGKSSSVSSLHVGDSSSDDESDGDSATGDSSSLADDLSSSTSSTDNSSSNSSSGTSSSGTSSSGTSSSSSSTSSSSSRSSSSKHSEAEVSKSTAAQPELHSIEEVQLEVATSVAEPASTAEDEVVKLESVSEELEISDEESEHADPSNATRSQFDYSTDSKSGSTTSPSDTKDVSKSSSEPGEEAEIGEETEKEAENEVSETNMETKLEPNAKDDKEPMGNAAPISGSLVSGTFEGEDDVEVKVESKDNETVETKPERGIKRNPSLDDHLAKNIVLQRLDGEDQTEISEITTDAQLKSPPDVPDENSEILNSEMVSASVDNDDSAKMSSQQEEKKKKRRLLGFLKRGFSSRKQSDKQRAEDEQHSEQKAEEKEAPDSSGLESLPQREYRSPAFVEQANESQDVVHATISFAAAADPSVDADDEIESRNHAQLVQENEVVGQAVEMEESAAVAQKVSREESEEEMIPNDEHVTDDDASEESRQYGPRRLPVIVEGDSESGTADTPSSKPDEREDEAQEGLTIEGSELEKSLNETESHAIEMVHNEEIVDDGDAVQLENEETVPAHDVNDESESQAVYSNISDPAPPVDQSCMDAMHQVVVADGEDTVQATTPSQTPRVASTSTENMSGKEAKPKRGRFLFFRRKNKKSKDNEMEKSTDSALIKDENFARAATDDDATTHSATGKEEIRGEGKHTEEVNVKVTPLLIPGISDVESDRAEQGRDKVDDAKSMQGSPLSPQSSDETEGSVEKATFVSNESLSSPGADIDRETHVHDHLGNLADSAESLVDGGNDITAKETFDEELPQKPDKDDVTFKSHGQGSTALVPAQMAPNIVTEDNDVIGEQKEAIVTGNGIVEVAALHTSHQDMDVPTSDSMTAEKVHGEKTEKQSSLISPAQQRYEDQGPGGWLFRKSKDKEKLPPPASKSEMSNDLSAILMRRRQMEESGVSTDKLDISKSTHSRSEMSDDLSAILLRRRQREEEQIEEGHSSSSNLDSINSEHSRSEMSDDLASKLMRRRQMEESGHTIDSLDKAKSEHSRSEMSEDLSSMLMRRRQVEEEGPTITTVAKSKSNDLKASKLNSEVTAVLSRRRVMVESEGSTEVEVKDTKDALKSFKMSSDLQAAMDRRRKAAQEAQNVTNAQGLSELRNSGSMKDFDDGYSESTDDRVSSSSDHPDTALKESSNKESEKKDKSNSWFGGFAGGGSASDDNPITLEIPTESHSNAEASDSDGASNSSNDSVKVNDVDEGIIVDNEEIVDQGTGEMDEDREIESEHVTVDQERNVLDAEYSESLTLEGEELLGTVGEEDNSVEPMTLDVVGKETEDKASLEKDTTQSRLFSWGFRKKERTPEKRDDDFKDEGPAVLEIDGDRKAPSGKDEAQATEANESSGAQLECESKAEQIGSSTTECRKKPQSRLFSWTWNEDAKQTESEQANDVESGQTSEQLNASQSQDKRDSHISFFGWRRKEERHKKDSTEDLSLVAEGPTEDRLDQTDAQIGSTDMLVGGGTTEETIGEVEPNLYDIESGEVLDAEIDTNPQDTKKMLDSQGFGLSETEEVEAMDVPDGHIEVTENTQAKVFPWFRRGDVTSTRAESDIEGAKLAENNSSQVQKQPTDPPQPKLFGWLRQEERKPEATVEEREILAVHFPQDAREEDKIRSDGSAKKQESPKSDEQLSCARDVEAAEKAPVVEDDQRCGGIVSGPKLCLIALVLLILGAGIGIGVGVAVGGGSDEDRGAVPIAPPPTQAPVISPTSNPVELGNRQTYELLCGLVSDCNSLLDNSTTIGLAYNWLVTNNSDLSSLSDERKTTRFALAALFIATEGDSWVQHEGWLTEEDECNWYGCSCNQGTQALVTIDLDTNNVQGTLPAEIGLLSNVERFVIRNPPAELPSVGGTLPSQIGSLLALNELVISGNAFSGVIPGSIGFLGNLQSLDLNSNGLVGSIPSEFAGLTNLLSLILRGNMLSGSMPAEFIEAASQLQQLDLQDNELTGFAEDVTGLSSLATLMLGSNRISGFPVEVTRIITLTLLDIHDNKLGSTIPVEIGDLLNLKALYLSGNKLLGTIPPEIGKLAVLSQVLDLSDNALKGTIPTELGELVRLRNLLLNQNQISGNVPASLANLTKIQTIRLDETNLTGVIPTSICELYATLQPLSYADCGSGEIVAFCFTYCCTDGVGCYCRYENSDPTRCIQ